MFAPEKVRSNAVADNTHLLVNLFLALAWIEPNSSIRFCLSVYRASPPGKERPWTFCIESPWLLHSCLFSRAWPMRNRVHPKRRKPARYLLRPWPASRDQCHPLASTFCSHTPRNGRPLLSGGSLRHCADTGQRNTHYAESAHHQGLSRFGRKNPNGAARVPGRGRFRSAAHRRDQGSCKRISVRPWRAESYRPPLLASTGNCEWRSCSPHDCTYCLRRGGSIRYAEDLNGCPAARESFAGLHRIPRITSHRGRLCRGKEDDENHTGGRDGQRPALGERVRVLVFARSKNRRAFQEFRPAHGRVHDASAEYWTLGTESDFVSGASRVQDGWRNGRIRD